MPKPFLGARPAVAPASLIRSTWSRCRSQSRRCKNRQPFRARRWTGSRPGSAITPSGWPRARTASKRPPPPTTIRSPSSSSVPSSLNSPALRPNWPSAGAASKKSSWRNRWRRTAVSPPNSSAPSLTGTRSSSSITWPRFARCSLPTRTTCGPSHCPMAAASARQCSSFTHILPTSPSGRANPTCRPGIAGPLGSPRCFLPAWPWASKPTSTSGNGSPPTPPTRKCAATSPSPSHCYGCAAPAPPTQIP